MSLPNRPPFGAGAGSVAIEWMLADPTLRAIAIEGAWGVSPDGVPSPDPGPDAAQRVGAPEQRAGGGEDDARVGSHGEASGEAVEGRPGQERPGQLREVEEVRPLGTRDQRAGVDQLGAGDHP